MTRTMSKVTHLHAEVVILPPKSLQLVMKALDDALLPLQLTTHALKRHRRRIDGMHDEICYL